MYNSMFDVAHAMMYWMAILLPVFLILIALVIVMYVFESLGLYMIAKRRGIAAPGLAWVPVAMYWIVGSIAKDYDLKTKGNSLSYEHILLWLGLGIFVVAFIPYLNWIVGLASIVLAVFNYMALYRIYKSCTPGNEVVLLVLSIIFPVIIPFVLFANRNSDKGMPLGGEKEEVAEEPEKIEAPEVTPEEEPAAEPEPEATEPEPEEAQPEPEVAQPGDEEKGE